jgi:two-component system response regulator NreC
MSNIKQDSPLHVLVVDDDELIQAAFSLLVESFEGVELAGMASTGQEALEQALLLKPDLILMDLRMPVMDGFEATRQIKAVLKDIKIVALTSLDEAHQITRAIQEGMDGFLLKKASLRELRTAITTVASGEQYLSPEVNAIMAKAYLEDSGQKHDSAPVSMLTPRETQVVKRIAEGMRIKSIADELKISDRTVEKHCEQARRKLNAATTGEMVAIWLRLQK